MNKFLASGTWASKIGFGVSALPAITRKWAPTATQFSCKVAICAPHSSKRTTTRHFVKCIRKWVIRCKFKATAAFSSMRPNPTCIACQCAGRERATSNIGSVDNEWKCAQRTSMNTNNNNNNKHMYNNKIQINHNQIYEIIRFTGCYYLFLFGTEFTHIYSFTHQHEGHAGSVYSTIMNTHPIDRNSTLMRVMQSAEYPIHKTHKTETERDTQKKKKLLLLIVRLLCRASLKR